MQRIFSRYIQAAATLTIALTVAACSQQTNNTAETASDNTTATEEVPQGEMLYGLPVDSFDIVRETVGRRETLSTILQREGVSLAEVYRIDNGARSVFDFRSLKRNNAYALFFTPDSLHTLKHIFYEIDNRTTYLHCAVGETIETEVCERTVKAVERKSSAEVTSSLWMAVKEQDLSFELSDKLSDIFAWVVDFFAIDQGDYFKVIYDELYSDSTRVGVGQVKAAVFHHKGKDYYAFYFEQDTVSGYFDEKGNSLRKKFLKAPLKYSRISSHFSHGRRHPILRIVRPHHGVDYAAPSGTPVMSIGDGTVIAKGWDKKGGGNYVKVRHNSVYTTVYMHLRGFAKDLKKGSQVKQGEVIGYVGKTGLATGPHLDFRVYKNGQAVNPLHLDAPDDDPVEIDDLTTFNNMSDSLRDIIDEMAIELHKPEEK